MTRLLAVFALATCLCVAFAQDDTSSGTSSTTTATQSSMVTIGPFMTSHNLSWEDAAAALAIAQATGTQPDVIVTSRPSSVTMSYYDLAPAYVIAHEANQPVSAVIDLYNGGQTWLQIANKYNVPVTIWNPDNADTANWANQDFANAVWHHILMTQYGMGETDYAYFHDQNVPWNEVVVAQVYGRETNHPIREVWTTYSNGGNQWTTVQTTYAQVVPTTTQTTETTRTTTTQEQTHVTVPPPTTPIVAQSTTTTVRSTSTKPATLTYRSSTHSSRRYVSAHRTRHYTYHRTHRYTTRTGTRALRYASTTRRRATHRHTSRRHTCRCCCCK